MSVRSLKYLFLIGALSIIVITCGPGCANIIAPSGGPRDTLPPALVQVSPADSSLNFREKKITFTFDEFVTLDNVTQNLIVSPVPNITPDVDSKLRTVTVKIKDTLEPGVTYSINFGNALKDINEGNVLKAFTYVFSTGNQLEKNRLTGRVLLAETGLADSTLTVMLHRRTGDSVVMKERPRYIARVDRTGSFTFSNLPAGTFYLYALKDESGTLRYQSKAQLFGFVDKPVVIADTTAPVSMYAFFESEEALKKPVTPAVTKQKASADKRLLFQNNLENGQQDLLKPFELLFLNPLKTFDTAQVQFTAGKFVPVSNYRFTGDSANKTFRLVYNWIPDTLYHLVLNKEFAEDSSGRKLVKIDTITFRTRKETDYGSLKLRFPSLDLKRNPVLQLVQSDKVIYSSAFTSTTFYQRLVVPGEYQLRILYDDNRNGTWDTGNFALRRQPEVVQAITQTVKVKGNWDNDTGITF